MKQVLIIVATIVAIMAILIGVLIMSNEHANNQASAPSSSSNTTGAAGSTRTTADGIKITDNVVGTGTEVKAGDTVTVDYTGTLDDGTVFDASDKHGGPATFPLGNVIQGWQEGIPGMKVGGTRTLVIPPALGYGSAAQSGIPANSTLTFKITLHDTKSQ